MPAGQAEEIIALALVFAVHVVGGVLLVWALLDGEQRRRRRWWGGGGGDDPPPAPPPSGGRRGTPAPLPLPLQDARPSAVRLREPVHVADVYPRPSRRPQHPAPPAPQPAPERRRRA